MAQVYHAGTAGSRASAPLSAGAAGGRASAPLPAAVLLVVLATVSACGRFIEASNDAVEPAPPTLAIVLPSDAGVQAEAGEAQGIGAADGAPACPATCTSCTEGRCLMDCSDGHCRRGYVNCPAGLPCDVRCRGVESCGDITARTYVICAEGSPCTLDCLGSNACRYVLLSRPFGDTLHVRCDDEGGPACVEMGCSVPPSESFLVCGARGCNVTGSCRPNLTPTTDPFPIR